MNTVTTSYKHNGVPVSIPRGSYGVTRLTARLYEYLEDDRLEFSNNRAERSIKPFVMGRKDFLFCDTPGGPRSSAVLYSLIETAKETGLGPYRYTQDFIRFHAGGLSGSSRIMIGRKSMIE